MFKKIFQLILRKVINFSVIFFEAKLSLSVCLNTCFLINLIMSVYPSIFFFFLFLSFSNLFFYLSFSNVLFLSFFFYIFFSYTAMVKIFLRFPSLNSVVIPPSYKTAAVRVHKVVANLASN